MKTVRVRYYAMLREQAGGDEETIAIPAALFEELRRKHGFTLPAELIDEVKARVPIWKREHYYHAAAEWIGPVGAKARTLVQTERKRKTSRRRISARVQAPRG